MALAYIMGLAVTKGQDCCFMGRNAWGFGTNCIGTIHPKL